MRATLRQWTIGSIAAVLVLSAAPPAYAAPGESTDAVALVVGLRAGADPQAPTERLAAGTDIDVVATEPVDGTRAVTVEVPGDEVGEAAAALRRDPAVAYVELDHVALIAEVTANDPYRGSQWGVDVAGVAAAWQTTTGSADVTVAVVDTGVTSVSDLAGALLPGYNAISDSALTADDNGHGTQTATVLAGRGDNGIGAAGVCWTCKILPVKVLGADGSGSYSDIAAGITWAADNGADIINLSLGGDFDGQVLRDAVADAVGKGALVIAAAGNAGNTALHYPAAIPAVLAVGASTVDDTRYPFSNYGTGWVDLAAPGCNMAQAVTGAVKLFCGTSSAAPFAAGVAALALAARPTATAGELSGLLTGTATALPTRWVASGRVNAAAAVDVRAPVLAAGTLVSGAAVRDSVAVPVNAVDNVGIRRVELLVAGRIVGVDRVAPWAPVWATGSFNGPAVVTIRAYDLAGNSAVATRTVYVDNTAPAVRITRAPRTGTRGIRGTATVLAGATDRYRISRVEVLVNGRLVARDTLAPYVLRVPTWRYGSKLVVRVRAYDRAGNVRYAPTLVWYR